VCHYRLHGGLRLHAQMKALNCANILGGFGRRRQGTPEEAAAVACVVRPGHRFSPASPRRLAAALITTRGKDDRACPRRVGHSRRVHAGDPPGPARPYHVVGAARRARRSRRPSRKPRLAGRSERRSLARWTSAASCKCWILEQGTSASTSNSAGPHHGTLPRPPDRSSASRTAHLQLEQVPLTTVGLGVIDLQPTAIAGLVREL
jgi:hypothetical protein